ncbi:class I SAM-dependent methyltransferase [Spirosoma spitsbergense]|uniref:class I SAM-dependent methyltransferase n=1 Tax=Spirosoma spitsbergense TaxID=431554 RepID=UPI000372B772|nr:class I SAM-dependent methyltransferase [Spirosoma spitsbergense]
MKDPWLERWEDRYGKNEYAYGVEPNEYLKEQLQKLTAGTILFPAEGEGRNAVFAAKLGWKVSAFDISTKGRDKALQLAWENNVSIDYQVGELPALNYKKEQFDVIALIYAHFPASLKSAYHQLLSQYLRKGGLIIFESFSKNHLEYRRKNEKVGGPADVESLFSIDELTSDFKHYDSIELIEKVISLKEGIYHNGEGSVIRFVGRKE